MRTMKYQTLRGMLRQTSYGRITLNDMNCGRFYHRTKGWVNFELRDSEKDRFYLGVAGVLWCKPNNVHIARVRRAKYMGILDRVWYDGKRYEYCAGQDYVGEIRFIQSQLLRG